MSKRKDPLTKRRRKEFLADFLDAFNENYETALNLSDLTEWAFENGKTSLAKAVLIVTVERHFSPLTWLDKQLVNDLQYLYKKGAGDLT